MTMYSPKIYDKLIPALYLTARDRSIPMTRLVNGFLFRSLLVERLPQEAYQKLPRKNQYPICPQLGLDGRMSDAEKQYLQPMQAATQLASGIKPFDSIEAIEGWYHASLEGIARNLALARQCLRAPTQRRPGEMNIEWKYETAVVQLNQIMVDSMVHLGADLARQRCAYEPAGGGEEVILDANKKNKTRS